MHNSSPYPIPAIDQTLALLELQDTILNRIRLESRLWSLRSELAVVESDENQAREAQVDAERAVEEAKKKTERAAEKGRTIKVELRFLTEQIAEFDKEMAEYKAQLVKTAKPKPEPPAVVVAHDVQPSAAALLMAGAGMYSPDRPHQNPIGSGYRHDVTMQPVKQEYSRDPATSFAANGRQDFGAPLPPTSSQAPAALAEHQPAGFHDSRAAFESFRPMAQSSSLPAASKPIAFTARSDGSSRPGRDNSWTPFGHSQARASSLVSRFNDTASQSSITSTFSAMSHATTTATHPANDTDPATAPTDDDASMIKKSADPNELKSQRLIAAVKELTGHEPEHFAYSDRTYFLAGPLAGVFSPSLKDPNKAASAHARKYGCDAAGQFREGVRKQGGRWAMTVEAFEDYVLSHLRSPRFIKY